MIIENLHVVLHIAAEIVEVVAIAILALGAVKFIYRYVGIELRRDHPNACTMSLQAARRGLGSYILVALEFLIVSDVILTVVDVSRDNLIDLGVIVVVRTAIGYFLDRELREITSEPT